MNVLVTGANGLLGHHVVFELLKKKHTVHIIVRSTHAVFFDLNLVTVFTGNFTNHENLLHAARGCDAMIHIAAETKTNLLHSEDYRSINVEGVAQVLKVANELNINRIVHISSANTVGFGNEQQLANERFTIQYPFTESFYAQSKLAAEQLVIEASKEGNRHFIIINPSFMIGAYDTKPGSGKLVLMGFKKKVMVIPGGGKNFVPVRNVAIAVCNALTMGRNGERYLASGINLSFMEYYLLQKEVGRYSQKIIILPDFLILSLGLIGNLIRRSGIRTELCTMNMRQIIIREYYSNTKAKAGLDLPDTELKIAIKEAIYWFKKQHMA